VTVRGQGRGGRNQEFALAAGIELATLGPTAVAASLGTDGIDGPTDAAGAVVATDTLERARCAGLESPETWLEDNNSYAFFAALGDLIVTGPTETNVGDVQIVLTE
jgi:hydroxypyruvate reductase